MIICGILCIIFATTKNMGVFLVIVVCLTFVSGNIQLNVVPNNIMNIWFPHKKRSGTGMGFYGSSDLYSNHYPDSECNRKSTDCLHYHRHRIVLLSQCFPSFGQKILRKKLVLHRIMNRLNMSRQCFRKKTGSSRCKNDYGRYRKR